MIVHELLEFFGNMNLAEMRLAEIEGELDFDQFISMLQGKEPDGES